MFCCKEKKPSTLPPPCCHPRPIPFRCPSYGCLSSEPRLIRCCSPPRSYPPLTCRLRPEPPPPPPTICIAGPCPRSSKSLHCPVLAPKILPPPSRVQFCIRFTNEGSRYYPCYYSDLPKCPSFC